MKSQYLAQYLIEVENSINAVARSLRPPKWKGENYIGAGQSKLTYLDLKIPEVRKLYKNGFSFSKEEPQAQWKIWDYIWENSNIFEVLLLPCFWASTQRTEDFQTYDALLFSWLKKVDNWALSDSLSSLYAKLLEHNAEKYLPVYKKWSLSKNSWARRQSLVGLIYYAGARNKVLPCKKILLFTTQHMNDQDYYVQKGVGWTLRECWNVYPKETFEYLKKQAKNIAPAAWTAATEKLSRAQKSQLTKIRKS